MAQKLTKMETAARLDVSQSTIDRMIQRGELQIEKEPHGSRHKIWVLMDGADAAASDNSPEDSHDAAAGEMPDVVDMSEAVELAVLRERVKNLEELADYHRELLKDSEWRYQQAMEQINTSPENRGEPHSSAAGPGARDRCRSTSVLVALRKRETLRGPSRCRTASHRTCLVLPEDTSHVQSALVKNNRR